MRRRDFIRMIAASVAAWPRAVRAQADKLSRIGFIGLQAAEETAGIKRIEAFRAGLREFGYVEGRNVLVEDRWAAGQYGRLPELASQLVRLNVDVIVAHGFPGTRAAMQATTTIPVVMVGVGDAIISGVVSSISQPSGNVTGSTFFGPEIVAKRVELIKEAVPSLAKVGVLVNYARADNEAFLPLVRRTADALKVELLQFSAREPGDFDGLFSTITASGVGGLAFSDDGMLVASSEPLARLALQHRLPSVAGIGYPEAGGLMYYGVNFPDLFRRAAAYVDKILKGAKPRELPIERPTKFETVLNLKTAKALGLEVPTSLLLRADQVIE